MAKWEHRKGQDILLRTFEQAFEPGDDVRLWLACHQPTPTERDEEWQRRCAESPLADLIEIVPRQPTPADVATHMAEAHCGVFPARAEGWNLPLLEMLARGRPVIATDWGAHGAYLDADNARLVTVDRTEPAVDDRWITVYSERKTGEWAHLGDAQVEQLTTHLRQVHSARQAGRLQLNDAGIATAARHTWAASAEALVAAMQ
ncbi:MAG: glycosyltransferase [Actinomycetota bacterium]